MHVCVMCVQVLNWLEGGQERDGEDSEESAEAQGQGWEAHGDSDGATWLLL